MNVAGPEEGGEALAASNPQLALLLSGKLEEVTTDPGSELVIGFKNRQSALIEGCAWWIGGTEGGNLKDFELNDASELSLRAASGFLSRIEKSSLKTHPRFIPDLRNFVR